MYERSKNMKCRFIFLSGLASIIASCSGSSGSSTVPPIAIPPTPTPTPTPAPSPTPTPTSVALTVVNGFGPTTAAPASQVELWSAILPQSQVLMNWTGGTFTTDDEEWHATLTVPSTAATLTANIQTLDITFTTRTYAAPTSAVKTARFWVPPNPRGLILILHGSGGSSNFIEATETRSFALKAISKGFAVLAPEAEEVAAGDLDGNGKIQWNIALTTSNTDFRALDTLLGSLVSNNVIPAGLPYYVAGMSNGGSMAVSLGAVAAASGASFPNLRFKAVISYCAQAGTGAPNISTTPTAFFLCGNDDNVDVSNSTAQSNSQTLITRGIPSVAALHPATPLYDQRFIRVAGVTVTQSRAIATELRNAGYLNANGFFNTPTPTISNTVIATPASFPTISALTATQQRDIADQIRAMQAEHQFYSDWTSRSLRWFATYP